LSGNGITLGVPFIDVRTTRAKVRKQICLTTRSETDST
jgi:hypothetical protein